MSAIKQLDVAPTQDVAEVRDISDGILAVIARAATDPNVDVEKMERLFALKERAEARQAEVIYSEAKAAAQAEMPQIKRTGKNDTTRSTFAELDEIAAKIDPISHKHGFSMSYGTADCPLEGHYRVTCRLRHRCGFFEDFQADVPSDTVGMKGNQNKTPTHGFGSTMSYGRRYLKLLVWDIATTDDDGRAASSGGPIDDAQYAALTTMLQQYGASTAKFLRQFGIQTVNELPAARYADAVKLLNDYHANKVAKQAAEVGK